MFLKSVRLLRKFLVASTVMSTLASASFDATASYTSITVFGDSLSDGGNDNLLTGGNFPPASPYAKRFSNGPTAVEVMAGKLGLSLTPSLSGGNNYAFGGAETGTGNYLAVRIGTDETIKNIFSSQTTGALAQVASYTGSFNADSLVVLWAGANDIFTALTLGQNLGNIIVPAMDNLSASVSSLYAKGARHILMPNLPGIGSTPFGRATGASNAAGLEAFSAYFNDILDQTIDALEAKLAGLDIIEFDTFGLLKSVESNPGAYGLSNATQSCFNGTSVCANPDQYLFWDDVHPTARGHQILGAAFYAAIPEPGTLMLLILGIAGLRFSRSRKA